MPHIRSVRADLGLRRQHINTVDVNPAAPDTFPLNEHLYIRIPISTVVTQCREAAKGPACNESTSIILVSSILEAS